MRTVKFTFVAALFVMGLQSQTCQACGRPPPPPVLPCIGFVNNSLVLQLGTIFQTNSISQCAAGIGLVGPPSGLNFSMAVLGVENTATNNFTPIFALNRFNGSDATWATGTDMNNTPALPGATWFGFSNLNVPPVTPPTLLVNEIFAIEFVIQGPFNPTLIQGLTLQYGSGAGLNTGLPDFNHVADPGHSAIYSSVVTVPGFGTNNWGAVPEPATYVYMLSALTIFTGKWGAGRIRRLRCRLGRGQDPTG